MHTARESLYQSCLKNCEKNLKFWSFDDFFLFSLTWHYKGVKVSNDISTGPLLFLIHVYVNDIGNACISKNINDKIMLFADDTNAFTVNKDLID